jgi:DNA-binding beta-propeller fold protein YncE
LSVTNLNSYGTGAVFFGHLTVVTNITASSFIGSGTGAAQLQLFSTNGNAAVLGISSDTISVTNVLGVSRRGTNNLMFDMNFVGKFTITNKFDFAASITFSNCAEGQEYAGILSGGGTSRVITFRADTNCLFADLDAFGVARATTKAVTLTNGNDMEISAYVTRPLGSAFGTTNVINLITRQYAQ